MRSNPINSRYRYFRPVKRPTNYYKDYDTLMDEQDKEMLKSMNSNLDILLTFAGLFSGVNSGFIGLSLALFNPSSSDTTDSLLRLLVKHADNNTLTQDDLFPSASPPQAGTTRVNCFFSASLVISLVVSLGSIIGKQWLIYYDRSSDVDPFQDWKTWRPLGNEHRGRVRYRKLHGLQQYRLRAILEAWLPMLLQLSVLIFFVGLIDFLHIYNPTVAWITLAIVALGVAAYVYTLQAAVRDHDCPFQTPVSTIFLPWVDNWNWRWSSVAKFFKRIIRGVGNLLKWIAHLLGTISKWIINRLAELFGPFCSCFSRGGPAVPQDRNEPPAGADSGDPNTVSSVDIEVTAWMLSTAMNPKVLRSAAISLPLVHIPGQRTSTYVDQSAISHLLFLFRDSAEMLPESQLHQPFKIIPDAIIYARAALHLFISSFVQSHITALDHDTTSWWGTYLEILSSVISRKPSGLLRMHERLVRLIKDGNQGRNIFDEPSRDTPSVPLYMATLTTAWLSCACVHKNQDLFQTGDFWKSIRACLDGVLNKPKGEGKGTSVIPWNAINLAAWALAEVSEGNQARMVEEARGSTQGSPLPLSLAWDAYTSDTNIGTHINKALEHYHSRTNVSEEYCQDVQAVYIVVLNALADLAKDAGSAFTSDLRALQPHRIAIARHIVDPYSPGGASTRATGGHGSVQPGDPAGNEAMKLCVLDAVCTSFIDNDEQVGVFDPNVRPLWRAILPDPPHLKLHRILVNFLQHCLHKSGLESLDARTIFEECPSLKKAIIRSVTSTNERVRLAALRTLQYMARHWHSTAEGENILKCLATFGKEKVATLPETKEAICKVAWKLVSTYPKTTKPTDVLVPFRDEAIHSVPGESAVETMLAVWKTWPSRRLEEEQLLEEDRRSGWATDAVAGAIADHVEWRIRTPKGLDTISESLREFWDVVLAKAPSSDAIDRLRRILAPGPSTDAEAEKREKTPRLEVNDLGTGLPTPGMSREATSSADAWRDSALSDTSLTTHSSRTLVVAVPRS